jgi:hypothetical protein
MTMSGFFDLILVRMAAKSVALSLVNSRATMAAPPALAAFSNSSATP